MKSIKTILVMSVVSILFFSGTLAVSGCEYEGKTPGFWKNHLDAWVPTGYTPDMLVGDFFDIPSELSNLADDTLLEALSYKGGHSVEAKARILLRAAVAGLLNSAHPDINYIYTYGDLQWLVNYPLSIFDKDLMEQYKDFIDTQNNLEAEL